jgi:ubiquinone/menaquinone biosynthesis C-methylase UbiE
LNCRLKLLVFLLCAVAILFVFNTAYSALNTLSRLELVEAQRDTWQRPSDVIHALDLRPGNVVVDLGCGSGYFALKLSSPVGNGGRVIAEDIRRLPLVFLWVRTVQRGEHNVTVLHGEANDTHLPPRVNAVLIANTYHEFTDSQPILARVRKSLVPAGEVVVVDRWPNPANIGISENGDHEISPERVENQLLQANFEIVRRQDHFIDKDPDNEAWWLILARRP